ncbi:hypothetical protein Tco_0341200 [Tanacetum coccineum]
MHNNIMAAGSKDRPPMLGPGRYSQWRSRFLRYIDTKGNGEYLRKCIFEGPYKLTSVVIEAVAATNVFQKSLLTSTKIAKESNARNKLSEASSIKAIFFHKTKCIYRHKGKEIAKPVTPQSESVSEEDSDPEQAQRDKDMQKNVALLAKAVWESKVAGARGTVGSQSKQDIALEELMKRLMNRNWSTFTVYRQRFRGPTSKRKVRSTFADLKVKEEKDIDKMIEMDKQLKFLNEIVYTHNQSIQTIHMLAPKCSTYNGRPTFANPRYLKKAQSEKPCLYEIPYDTSDPANRFTHNREETMTLANESRSKLNKDTVKPYDYTKQNSLYEIFKAPSLDYLYQLERAKEVRKTMWRKPFVRTKPNIAKNVAFLPVSKSISKSRQVFNDMTFNINHFRTICEQAWSNHTSSYFRVPTAQDMEVLIKTLLMPLSIKSQNDSFRFEHELKTEMHEDYEYVKSLEKEVDELESEKADFSNIYDLLLEECVSKDVTCSYLHSLSDLNAYAELQCLYLHKVKECECLAQKLSKQTESVNKEVHNKLLKSFAKLENHSISLELALQQCKEQMKNNSVCKENGSNVFRKEREQYHEIQDLKAQMQDKNIAISELKKLIEKCKGKSVETQFDKPSVVRQPNAQRIPKPSVLGKPTPFSNSPEMRSFQTKQSVNKTNVSDGLFKQVTQQNLPQNRKQAEIHSNVLKPGMYRIATTTTQNREPQLPHASRNTNPHMSKSSGVNHTTSVSRPQLKCYQVKDKVVPNNSQVKFKKKEVEDHHRISSISKKTKSVTACNDSSKKDRSQKDIGFQSKRLPLCMRKQQVLDLVLGGNQRVEFSRLFVLDGFQQERHSPLAQQRYSLKYRPRSSMFTRRLIASDQASVFMAMMFEQRSLSLILHPMTFDHNRSELGIHDHSNEQSSSKLVPKVVP